MAEPEGEKDLKSEKEAGADRLDLKVIGIGGAGGNAINRMIDVGISGVEFVAMNTDSQVLKSCRAPNRLLLGENLTGGLGAGGKPEIGRKAANEDRDGILGMLEGAKMIFLTAGMGGGTGTGAAPVVAELSKELGILTVGIVTKPFAFEGPVRLRNAEDGIMELKEHVDTLITIPNDKILEVCTERLFINDAFARVDDTLRQAIQGVSSIIADEGVINVDFADIRTVMGERGEALMGIGLASGENRAKVAVMQAMRNPLTENLSITGAKSVLLWIRGGVDFEMREFSQIATMVQEEAGGGTNIITGYSIDQSLVDRIQVILIASGIRKSAVKQKTYAKDEVSQMPAISSPAWRVVAGGRIVRTVVSGIEGNLVLQEEQEELDIPSFLRRAKPGNKGSIAVSTSYDLADFRRDHVWIMENRQSLPERYDGQWIAVKNEKVIAHFQDLDALLSALPNAAHTCIEHLTRDEPDVVQ